MSTRTFAALINERLVIPSQGRPYFTVSVEMFQQLMEPELRRIHVDEPWYLHAYPDVRHAMQRGEIGSGKEHFVRFGYFEHRMPYEISVQEGWYLEEYPDIGAAVQAGLFESGQHHFSVLGYQEGRVPFPNFHLRLA